MERTAEEWGRIAVSLPGWRWSFPWASLPDEDGRVWRRNWCPSDPGFGWSQVAGPIGRRPTFEAIDPDDPATEGCLLALLGPRCLVRILPREGRALCEIVIPGDLTLDGRPHRITGHDLGRACIAAAEALGRWPGGEP